MIYLSSTLGSSCSQTVESNVTSWERFLVVVQAVKVNYFFFLWIIKTYLKIYLCFLNFTWKVMFNTLLKREIFHHCVKHCKESAWWFSPFGPLEYTGVIQSPSPCKNHLNKSLDFVKLYQTAMWRKPVSAMALWNHQHLSVAFKLKLCNVCIFHTKPPSF